MNRSRSRRDIRNPRQKCTLHLIRGRDRVMDGKYGRRLINQNEIWSISDKLENKTVFSARLDEREHRHPVLIEEGNLRESCSGQMTPEVQDKSTRRINGRR